MTAALFSAVAAVVGLLENLLPLEWLLPLPGVKLGTANIVVAAAYSLLGPFYALGVMLCRTLLVFFFSGNPVSFALSLGGSLLSFAGLCIGMRQKGKKLSYIGVSALSAACHGLGQLTAASLFTGISVFSYLPLLGAACTVTGALCGILMNLFLDRIVKEGERHAS